MTPVGEKGTWPHHTEYELGASQMLFAVLATFQSPGKNNEAQVGIAELD